MQITGFDHIPNSMITYNPFTKLSKEQSLIEMDDTLKLADSMSKFGVITPIIVRRKNNEYEVIAGLKRVMASMMSGQNLVPALIVEIDNSEIINFSQHENIRSVGLSFDENEDLTNRIIKLKNTQLKPGELTYIDSEEIETSNYNTDSDSVSMLKQSIKEIGIIQPIIIQENEYKELVIISGYHRIGISQILNLPNIPFLQVNQFESDVAAAISDSNIFVNKDENDSLYIYKSEFTITKRKIGEGILESSNDRFRNVMEDYLDRTPFNGDFEKCLEELFSINLDSNLSSDEKEELRNSQTVIKSHSSDKSNITDKILEVIPSTLEHFELEKYCFYVIHESTISSYSCHCCAIFKLRSKYILLNFMDSTAGESDHTIWLLPDLNLGFIKEFIQIPITSVKFLKELNEEQGDGIEYEVSQDWKINLLDMMEDNGLITHEENNEYRRLDKPKNKN